MDKEQAWIVRTKDLFITRPMKQDDLIAKIEKGELSPLDEICPGNGYWFSLHEAEEVRKHLGDIDLSQLTSGIEIEITSSTETNTVKKTLILEIPKSWNHPTPEPHSMLAPSPVYQPRSKAPGTQPSRDVDKQWTPAIIFGIIFTVVLVFLWLNSD